MRRKWKGLSALCLAGLIGCLVPVNTMRAEEAAETQETISGNDLVDEKESESDEQAAIQNYAESDEPMLIAMQDDGIAPTANVQDISMTISFSSDSDNHAQSPGGTIEYKYINNPDQRFTISASVSSGETLTLSYYLDTEASAEGRDETWLSQYSGWTSADQNANVPLDKYGKYVLYVKVAADNENYYFRSDGVVVDTEKPEIIGIEMGGTYPEGTEFEVKDDNLENVWINNQEAGVAGKYQVIANGNSCVVKARDKAGNEETVSVTVAETILEPEDGAILKSGKYSLQKDTEYTLGDGSWMVLGDSTVYRGGITFYMGTDGEYVFYKKLQ